MTLNMELTALSVTDFVDAIRETGLSTSTFFATNGGMGVRTQTASDAPDALSRRRDIFGIVMSGFAPVAPDAGPVNTTSLILGTAVLGSFSPPFRFSNLASFP